MQEEGKREREDRRKKNKGTRIGKQVETWQKKNSKEK